MFSTAKCALTAALVLAATFQASAATKAAAPQRSQATVYDVIPGYGKDGGRVAVPDPNR